VRDDRQGDSEWLAGDFLERHLGHDRDRARSSTIGERRRHAAAQVAYALACKLRWQGVLARSYFYRINQRAWPPGHDTPFAGEGSLLASADRPGALALHESLTFRAATAAPLRCATRHDDDGLVTVQGLTNADASTGGALIANLRSSRLPLTLAFARARGPRVARAATLDDGAALGERGLTIRADGAWTLVDTVLAPFTSELVTLG
jgi:hypothetical protein